ncbi:MAG: hypothetical protein HY719_14075 [Planctomycetes bacterium]|nr:hypothetical protein [Planctomycetota bacterium]
MKQKSVSHCISRGRSCKRALFGHGSPFLSPTAPSPPGTSATLIRGGRLRRSRARGLGSLDKSRASVSDRAAAMAMTMAATIPPAAHHSPASAA